MTDFYGEMQKELDILKASSLFRQTITVETPPEPWIAVGSQTMLNLAGNNYLGLANHPVLKEAAVHALQKYGTGTAGSRLVVGTSALHEEVEEALARFQGRESALLFSSGYCANLGVIQALVGRNDYVFSDKLNHASIVDGIILSRAKLKRYRHKDLDHLEKLLKNTTAPGRKLIITDSIFSMDGDRAPIKELVELKQRYGAMLMLDEAHGEGVFGPKGRGLAAHEMAAEHIDIHLGTLSKAFGCLGAYVAGSKTLVDYLRNKCRSFIYTTSLPPAVLGSILGALKVIAGTAGDRLRRDLRNKSKWMINELNKLGFSTLDSDSQIIPILIPGNDNVINFSKKLRQRGILALPIRVPTVPKNSERIRVSLMATHSMQDLTYAVEQFANIKREERV
ncbi:8-amino-7-oxononanoate synthase [Desulfohalotomaculum tongense]|uniref:8-amino-7-oxononanoate synthase n=1 Tax=Desulforadius tongensis TaxID=1216062 RepID=UPI00195A6188|nr:8-amino-7-oxononanoate synthase [Desulforadius tongensis]MBM7854729.1 8-amino-7-oxononanoate synthase [Desulforadius tongensis]